MTATTRKPIIDRSKVIVTAEPNGINYNVLDRNPTRRCTASIINVGCKGWCVRIDKGGVDGWKYAANIPVSCPEAAYEYCHEFGTRVND